MRSRDAISEPFVSFLIDVNWPRGRLLREYTVLLDPPALVAAKDEPGRRARGGADDSAARARPSAPPPAPPAPQPSPAPPACRESSRRRSTYQVARGDTLYGIAGSLAGDDRQAIEKTMIAVFRANPDAFSGNINQLRAGAILRIPPSAEIASIAAAEAAE